MIGGPLARGRSGPAVRAGAARCTAVAVLFWLFMWAAPAALASAEGAPGPARSDPPLRVVASFSILADMVRQVAGDDVQLSVIVGPLNDPHTFEPRPRDARALGAAELLVVNGLGFESWLPRLLASSGFRGHEIVASAGVVPRVLGDAAGDPGAAVANDPASDQPSPSPSPEPDHPLGSVDPHAWQDLSNGVIYVRNIAQGLARADPRHAQTYRRRAAAYIRRLYAAEADWRAALAVVPPQRRVLVTTHDAFGYFAAAYGIQVRSLLGLSDEAEPSARAIARLIREIRAQKIDAVFLEQGVSAGLLRQIADEAGVKLGGELFADTLNKAGTPPSTYLEMFRWNTQLLLRAFQGSSH